MSARPPQVSSLVLKMARWGKISKEGLYNKIYPTVAYFFENYVGDNFIANLPIERFLTANAEDIKAMSLEVIEGVFETVTYRIALRDRATLLVKASGASLPFGFECETFNQARELCLADELDETHDNDRHNRIYAKVTLAKLFGNVTGPPYQDWAHHVNHYVTWAIYLHPGGAAAQDEAVQKMVEYVTTLVAEEEEKES
jgi:hypothetical protein